MISFLSVLTSVKDYVEITHKLLEADPTLFQIKSYDEIGSLLTYFVLSIKDFLINFFTLNWIKNFWSLPIIVPDIASAMISEISILDGSFHNAFNFLETPLAYGQQNSVLYGGEKFFIGFLNSLFLVLPTSAAHIITLRRFIMQGVEIGYLAGLGTIVGNLLWLSSIIFGWRFFIIPWLSFDILRYLIGFTLLVKYLWDSTKERRIVLEDINKVKIFLLNFLLAFTEQTCIYPFLSNISISPEGSLLETFPAENFQQFIFIHAAYLFGIFVGSYSLLLFCCWFWEYPAFSIYLWIQTKSNYRFTTGFYYKNLNYFFTYLTMLAAISSIPYYGLDYTITKQLGFVQQDRLITQKPSLQSRSEYERLIPETSFLNIQATNMNLRIRDGQRPRRERWRQNFIKYEAFDVSVYDQGVYDFLTIEDLNYGFDRFWLRRKMRNHTTHFRLFPGSWMRTLKKQLLAPSKEVRRNDFFTLLFEQYYHPSFHKIQNSKRRAESLSGKLPFQKQETTGLIESPQKAFVSHSGQILSFPSREQQGLLPQEGSLPILGQEVKADSFIDVKNKYILGSKTRTEFSALRKFVRKFNSRIKTSEINFNFINISNKKNELTKTVYSKRWKHLYSTIWHGSKKIESQINFKNPFRSLSKKVFLESQNIKKQLTLFSKKQNQYNALQKFSKSSQYKKQEKTHVVLLSENFKRTLAREKLSKKDRQILRFRTLLFLNSMTRLPNFNIDQNEIPINQINISPFKEEKESYSDFSRTTSIDVSDKKLFASHQRTAKDSTVLKEAQSLPAQDPTNALMDFKIRTVLHPLKYYIEKEKAFNRKLKFYGSSIFRKLSIGNNAPYFRTIMKRGFYYYKKTLRWKRTANLAALRRGLRKTFRIPRKLVKNKNSILSEKQTDFDVAGQLKDGRTLAPVGVRTPLFPERDGFGWKETFKNPIGEKIMVDNNKLNDSFDSKTILRNPTHFYSNQGKRTSRYRFQIYKDVLQHWYYTPFNRLLLRFDIDAFINRQPKNHFLTKKEEQLLHLRRNLLGEHYDTLRWYTFMQHYRSMKNRIGGTKSFSSRTYNQQFQGTFKKIRHLFAITPSQTKNLSETLFGLSLNDGNLNSKIKNSLFKPSSQTPAVLKFDQNLYNEYENSFSSTSSLFPYKAINNNKKSGSIIEKSVFHEELLVPFESKTNEVGLNQKQDFINLVVKQNDSLSILANGLWKTKQNENQISDDNFNDLITKSTKTVVNFLLKSEPIRKEYITSFIKENKYSELLNFLYLGQKTKETRPILNEKQLSPFLTLWDSLAKGGNQGARWPPPFLTDTIEGVLNVSDEGTIGARALGEEWKAFTVAPFGKKVMKAIPSSSLGEFQQELWVQFLKHSKKRLNNRKFMKKYIIHRVNKREKRISRKQKNIKKRLQKMKSWLIPSTLLDYYPNKNFSAYREGVEGTLNDAFAFPSGKRVNERGSMVSVRKAPYQGNSLFEVAEEGTGIAELRSSTILTRGLDKTLKKGNLIQKTNTTSFYSNSLNSNFEATNEVMSKPIPTLWVSGEKESERRGQKNGIDSDFRAEQKIKVSLQAIKRVFDNNRTIANFSINTKKNINILAFKGKKILNSITKTFIEKSKPLYFFLIERPNHIKQSFWKKRQKVKNKARRQRKTIQEKSIPEQKYASLTAQKVKNNVVYYDNWVLQEFTSSPQSKQKIINESYYHALKSSLTAEGYQKIIPRFKQSKSINVFKNFINKQLKNKHFVFREYKKKRKKGKRSEYYPSYLYDYSSNKLRKIKWLNKQLLKNKTKKMSKAKKLRVLKNGGLIYSLISKIGITPTNPDSVAVRLNNVDLTRRTAQKTEAVNLTTEKQKAYSKKFELTWLKSDITKKYQSKKKKRRKRKFSIKTKYQKSINNRSKFHKRNIYRKGKLKKLGKQLKHIKSNIQLQLWWWQTYLPKFQLAFETNQFFNKISNRSNNYNYEAILPQEGLSSSPSIGIPLPPPSPIGAVGARAAHVPNGSSEGVPPLEKQESLYQEGTEGFLPTLGQDPNLLKNIYENILIKKQSSLLNNTTFYPEGVKTNPLPFYAGWDEASRKLVITNRLISRRDAGFNFQNLNEFNTLKPLVKISKENDLQFTLSPIFGLNELSFLYWENELPFTTYNIEQYNTNVISFYAPLGWRRFEFRHSILNTWLNFIKLNKNIQSNFSFIEKSNTSKNINNIKIGPEASLKTNLKQILKINSTKTFNFSNENSKAILDSNALIQEIDNKQKRTSQKFRHRRIKKRNKRSRSASGTFVFKPQGPLLTDILPSHYLSVFNSQYRLPRHRYLKYKLIKNPNSNSIKARSEYNNFLKENQVISKFSGNTMPSFTLRKRSKPKRKFHRKRLIKAGGLIFPRRRKFITKKDHFSKLNTDNGNSKFLTLRWRPSSESEFNLNQPKTRVKTDTIRRRKLRRKMFKQVYKPIQRFQPRYGGFTWSGDYPRLEWTNMPKLGFENKENKKTQSIQRKRATKQKRRLSMVGDLPHKYLLKKHNILVLKKKLEKAQRSNKIRERALELKNEIL
jgi:hypothetical protein